MHKLAAYRTLGLTRDERKRGMRENILRNAEMLHGMGLDSRIPLLKFHFTDEKVPNRTTARREDGVPVPEWKKGDVFGETSSEMAMRFNIFNAERGLQAVWNPDKRTTEVLGCNVQWLGDLRTVELEQGTIPGTEANYNNHWYMIVLDSDKSRSTFSHEYEHAVHQTLAMLSGFGISKYPTAVDCEYLSLLVQLISDRHAIMTNVTTKTWGKGIGMEKMIPHICASFIFTAKLLVLYGMTPEQIMDATDASYNEKKGEGNPNLGRMIEAGRNEYNRTYRKLFGLPLDDIREIIASIPMI